MPSTITMCLILQLSLATLISNDYLKNGANKPGFGAFSITVNPEKQTTGANDNFLVGHFL